MLPFSIAKVALLLNESCPFALQNEYIWRVKGQFFLCLNFVQSLADIVKYILNVLNAY